MRLFGNRSAPVLLGAILLLAAALRIWGAGYDLPAIYHPDEPIYISISQTIFKTGDLNPHFFNYPSLFLYVNALAYVPYYLAGKAAGVFQTPESVLAPISLAMGVTQAPMPTAVVLGRLVTIGMGLGVVVMTYAVGRRLTGRAAVGLLAALMVAVAPPHVANSRFVTPDTFVVFFALASLLTAVLVFQEGKTWHYVAAGLCVGLTASSKYNGALAVLPLLTAHGLRYGRTALREPKLYLALACCAAGFLATTPFALLDWETFWRDMRFEASHYASGHAGMEGDTLVWYVRHFWETGGLLFLLAAVGLVLGAVFHPKEAALLAIFPLAYFAFISSFIVRNERTALPLTPFLFVASSWCVIILLERFETWPNRAAVRWLNRGLAAFLIVALALPLGKTVDDTRRLTAVTARETASIWIAEHLPPGAKVAIESYAPFVDPTRYSVQGFWRMIDQEPAWYSEAEFDYLIFSYGMYGRYYLDPARYAEEVARYDAFFDQFALTKQLAGGNEEFRIYQVSSAQPTPIGETE